MASATFYNLDACFQDSIVLHFTCPEKPALQKWQHHVLLPTQDVALPPFTPVSAVLRTFMNELVKTFPWVVLMEQGIPESLMDEILR